MSAAPLVMVGVPVRNGSALLERALQALTAQTWANLRVVVSDNASTDDTADVIRRSARRDGRISWSHLDRPVSAFDNFRRVARQCAGGDLFMWAAHDDLWQPDHIERLVKALQERPDAGLAAFDTREVLPDGTTVRLITSAREFDVDSRLERCRRFIAQDEGLGKANLIYGLYRSDVLAAVGYGDLWSDPSLTDYHFLFQVLALAGVVVVDGVAFSKAQPPRPALPTSRSLRAALPAVGRWWQGTWTKQAWVRGYGIVLDRYVDLPREEERQLRRVLRLRRWQVFGERLARPINVSGRPQDGRTAPRR